MNIWKDLANDAGYPYGTNENEMMAMMIEEDYWREVSWEEYMREQENKWIEEQQEIYQDEMDYYDWLLSKGGR